MKLWNMFRSEGDEGGEPQIELGDEELTLVEEGEEPEPPEPQPTNFTDDDFYGYLAQRPDLQAVLAQQLRGAPTEEAPTFNLEDHLEDGDNGPVLDLQGANKAFAAHMQTMAKQVREEAYAQFKNEFGSTLQELAVDNVTGKIARQYELDDDGAEYVKGRLAKLAPAQLNSVVKDKDLMELLVDAAHGRANRKQGLGLDMARTSATNRSTGIKYGPDGRAGYEEVCKINDVDPKSKEGIALGKKVGALL